MDDDNIVDNIIGMHKVEPTEEELETFKNLVNDWFKYDDQIRITSECLIIRSRSLCLILNMKT
jgi:hypothetical protein